MTTYKRARALALGPIIAIPLLLSACAPSAPQPSADPPTSAAGAPLDQRLRLVTDFVNDTFPNPAPDYVEISYGNGEMLLKPQLGDPSPWLAKSVEANSDTEWVITLNEGITFQNGKPLDAAALKRWFDYEFENDPAAKGALGDPTAVTVTDDLTVTVTLPRLFTPFKNSLSNYIFAVYDSDAVAAVGEKFEELAGAGIFTGPYSYEGSEGGVVRYDRYDGYWQGTPAMAGLDVRKLADQAAGVQALANGEADLQVLPAVKLKRAAEQYPELSYLTSKDSVTYAAFNLHPGKAPFTDQSVRQAFAAAIDSEPISSVVMDGVWRPLAGVYPSDSDFAVDWREYDPDRARQLLEDAGWVAGADGVRSKAGTPLAVEIVTYTDDLEAVGNAAVEMLRDVGFDVTLRRVPDYSPIPELLTGDGPVNVNLLNLENFGLDGNPFATLCRNFEYDKGYNDVVRDDELNGMCQDLLATSDTAKRDQMFAELQRLNGERVYYVPVVDEPTTMLATEPYRGMEVNGFYLFIDWQTRPQ
jgi:peptide/nickel transport system substrate-binding protein